MPHHMTRARLLLLLRRYRAGYIAEQELRAALYPPEAYRAEQTGLEHMFLRAIASADVLVTAMQELLGDSKYQRELSMLDPRLQLEQMMRFRKFSRKIEGRHDHIDGSGI